MSLITKNNYEAFLLDYIEGNLSPEYTAELMLFFENNPELKEDLSDFDLVTLVAPEINLDSKESLKQESNNAVLPLGMEDLMVGEIEGVNTPNESVQLTSFLNTNPEHHATLELYRQTVLVPKTVVFEGKEGLKQENDKVIPLYWWYTSAAAVILVVFLLNVNWNGETPSSIIAEEDQIESAPKENETPQEVLEQDEPEQVFVAEEVPVQVEEQVRKAKVENPKANQTIIKQQKAPKNEDELLMAKNTPIKEDTLKAVPVQVDVEETQEILYADIVKIVYEDEPSENNEVANPIPAKKYTKFDAVRAAVKKQVQEKFLKKVKDESTLALNSGPLSFLRGKNKRQ